MKEVSRSAVMKSVAAVTVSMAVGLAAAETLDTGSLRVEFGPAEAGYGVRSVVNLMAGGVRFVNPDGKPTERWRVEEFQGCANRFRFCPDAGRGAADFWELELRDRSAPADRQRAVFVDNLSGCRACSCRKTPDGLAFAWKGVALPEGEMDVFANVGAAADGSTRWTIDVSMDSEKYEVFNTRYPMLRHVTKSEESDFLIPHSDVGARLFRKSAYGTGGAAFGVLAYVPMMTAFIVGDAGLYVGAHDAFVNTKTLVLTSEHDVAFSSPSPRGDFAVTVAPFKGDWWQAARIYRKWALTAPWCRKGRILDRSDYPRRMCEIPLWFNFHGDAVAASNALTEAKQKFPGVATGLHWHRWQAVPWEIGHYPEYFPEDTGVKACLDYCRSIGQEPMLYTLPRLYSKSLLSFHFASPYALLDEKGDHAVEQYGDRKGNPPELVPMCPAVKAWQDCIVDYSKRILDLGGRSIFQDQVASCPAKACYAGNHGHPAGGGNWFYRGVHDICSRVHDAYAARGALTTAEGSSDAFIDVVDGLLTVSPRTTDDLPFWHAVYGGYTTYFGTPENHDDDDDTFWALQTREMLWGQVMGWYHTLLMKRPSKVGMVNALIAFRQANLDCLAYGELLGEVRFEGEVPEIRLEMLGRMNFADWANPKAERSKTTYGSMPSMIGYAYRSGTTGKTTLLIANLLSDARKVSLSWDGVRRELSLSARELKRID